MYKCPSMLLPLLLSSKRETDSAVSDNISYQVLMLIVMGKDITLLPQATYTGLYILNFSFLYFRYVNIKYFLNVYIVINANFKHLDLKHSEYFRIILKTTFETTLCFI